MNIEFKQIGLGHWPVNFYQCIISENNLISYGYSIERKAYLAKTKSFHEAYERYVFKKLKKENSKYSSTNGFAAHILKSEASQKAKQELIERELLRIAWSEQTGWRKYKINYLFNKLIFKILKFHCWEISLFTINSKNHTALCGLAINKKMGTVFDSTYLNSKEESENKIINSLVRQIYFFQPESLPSMPTVGRPSDHRKYYSNPMQNKNFNFLFDLKFDNKNINLSNEDEIGVDFVESKNNMPIVAIASNRHWKNFSWGLQSIHGKNPFPHPLS